MEAFIGQIGAVSRERPVLMIFEDTHWADPSSLEKTEDGVTIKVEGKDGEETLEAEVLLVAVGRTTVVEALNLDATDVQLDNQGQDRDCN